MRTFTMSLNVNEKNLMKEENIEMNERISFSPLRDTFLYFH